MSSRSVTLSGLAPPLLFLHVPIALALALALALGLPLVLAMLLAETNIHIKMQSSLTSQKRVNHSLVQLLTRLKVEEARHQFPFFFR